MGMGDSLEWTLPDSLIAGSTQLDIVCTPYTRISATIDTLLLATAVSTADGIAHLSFNRSLAGDSLTLTATRCGTKDAPIQMVSKNTTGLILYRPSMMRNSLTGISKLRKGRFLEFLEHLERLEVLVTLAQSSSRRSCRLGSSTSIGC